MAQRMRDGIIVFFAGLWSLFLNGLLALLPITLTVVIFNMAFKLVKGWLQPLHRFNLPFADTIPHFEIIIVLLGILLFGAVLQIFVLRVILQHIEAFILRLPLVRPVYSGIKQLVTAFSSHDKVTFKQVVMLEFPIEHVYSIGFLTAEVPAILAPHKHTKYFNVFVPTTPNPTTGFFIVVPEHKITITQLTRQEAMTLIISGGIISPERFNR